MDRILIRLIMVVVGLCAFPSVWAQVDGSVTPQDTLYIIEEEVVYDTLYLYDTLPQPALMSKEDLIEAFRQDRGIGQIYYSKGHYMLTGNDEIYKLDNADLQKLLSPAQYDDYRKSRRNQYISIPLYAVGGGAVVIAGIGLVQFCDSFVQMAKYSAQSYYGDNLEMNFWSNAMEGLFFFGGGMLVATACVVPAAVLTIKSKVHLKRIAEDFNASHTPVRLSFQPVATGVGVTLLF